MKQVLSLLTLMLSALVNIHSQSIHAKQNSAGWTPGGMYYELYSQPWGDSVREGDFVKINLAQKINDSLVFTSYKSLPIYTQVMPAMPYDVSELWQMMKRGDSVYAVQLMDTFIKQTPESIPPQFKKGDSIKLYVKVLDVFKTNSLVMADLDRERDIELKKEILFITEYLTKIYIRAKVTPSQAFVHITTEGTGNLIDSGNTVSVKYSAMTFDGKVFDGNMDNSFGHTEPLTFKAGDGSMIKGLDEAMLLLKKGSKARIFIPSMLAYGENPSPPLLPLTNLIYEVTVLTVSK